EEQELEQHERAGISSNVEFRHVTSRESYDGSARCREACAVPGEGGAGNPGAARFFEGRGGVRGRRVSSRRDARASIFRAATRLTASAAAPYRSGRTAAAQAVRAFPRTGVLTPRRRAAC